MRSEAIGVTDDPSGKFILWLSSRQQIESRCLAARAQFCIMSFNFQSWNRYDSR